MAEILTKLGKRLDKSFKIKYLIKETRKTSKDRSFSTYAEFSEKVTIVHSVRNVSFSESFAYVLNERPTTDVVQMSLVVKLNTASS